MDENGEETNKDELHFFYDAQSKPAFVEYNGEMYRYIHNLQGDIVGIVDADGTLVVEYKYDAWGKPISMTGSLSTILGILNPFRYRGYVWDEEINFSYLQSRYYSPSKNRFINSDVLFGLGFSINTHNPYLYCVNNCIIHKDIDGYAHAYAAECGPSGYGSFGGYGVPQYNGGGGLASSVSNVGTAAVSLYIAYESEKVTEEIVTAAELKDEQPRIYTVYFLADPQSGDIVYVGRTKNLAKRMQQHSAPNSKTKNLVLKYKYDNLTLSVARGMEQRGMILHHTLNAKKKHDTNAASENGLNDIWGVSKNNKKRKIYFEASKNYIRNFSLNEYYNIMEEF